MSRMISRFIEVVFVSSVSQRMVLEFGLNAYWNVIASSFIIGLFILIVERNDISFHVEKEVP